VDKTELGLLTFDRKEPLPKTDKASSPPERHAMFRYVSEPIVIGTVRRPELAEGLYACPHGGIGRINMEISILRLIL
jgi:hypothetical protein